MLPIRTILHATDFSEPASHAFQFASALARDYGAKLIILHVVPPAPVPFAEGMVLSPEDVRPRVRAELAKMQIAGLTAPLERLLTEGDPVDAIVETANDKKCDLLVLGTHGWTGLTRLLMGSVAEGVIRRAPCPVLTVKMPTEQTTTPAAAREVNEPALR